MPGPTMTTEERFSRFIEKTDGCWEWKGHRSHNGYGQFRLNTKQRAHRVAYELWVGPIPEGLELDHLCRNPPCVRPDHLEPVTRQVNAQRAADARPPQTHCKRGHPYEGNRVLCGERDIGCRKCELIRKRERYVPKSGIRGAGQYQKAKTHCPQGHPYDEANTRLTKTGRVCRACAREANQRYSMRVTDQETFISQGSFSDWDY